MFGIAKGQLTIFWSTKWESMSQSPENIAWGSPQPLGSGLRVVISAGIAFRGKKYTDIAVLVHSVAYTPPPTALKPLPKVWELGDSIKQPAFVACPGAFTSQFEVIGAPG